MRNVTRTASTPAEILAAPELTAEEKAAIAQRMKDIDLLLKDERKAMFKLEVMFNRERSHHKPFPGVVTWWGNAAKLHGGGDSKLYMCPGKELRQNNCEAILTEAMNGGAFAVCPKCGNLWRPEEVVGEVFFRTDMQGWATVLTRWFIHLGMDADVRIKYARDDIRHASRLEQERQRGGELLHKVRSEERRSSAVYKLSTIIRDTSTGADLRNRFLAFLSA